ncbi:MAG: peroxiredoxin [Acidimicrobiales bacterium]
MTIAVGDKIPDVELRRMGKREPEALRSLDVLGRGKVVLFGLPGAFTPTCSDFHLPGYIVRAEDLKGKGVDLIACISVNDAYVMGAWGQAQGTGDAVMMLGDGNGEFTRAVGLDYDMTAAGLGVRSRRYAMILQDGVVTYLGVESQPGVSVSGADAVLAEL